MDDGRHHVDDGWRVPRSSRDIGNRGGIIGG
jgi:hypothetical protein